MGPTEKQYKTVDFVFKLFILVTSFLALLVPVGLIILDVFNIEPAFLTEEFVSKYSFFDYPEKSGERLTINPWVIAGSTWLIVLGLVLQLYRVLRRKNFKTTMVSEHFTSFSDSYAKYIVISLERMEEIRKDIEDGINPNNLDVYKKLVDANGEFLILVATRIASMAKMYTGKHCHVSIKVFSPHSGGIRTFARDQTTIGHREKVDEDFQDRLRNYQDNYVFKKIIENPDCHYFISNNLKRDGKYFNKANKSWSDFYNRCLVVPIASTLHPQRTSEILGFICIDSKKGVFKNDYFLSIVVILSRFVSVQFASVLSTLELRRQKAEMSVSDE